VLSPTDDGEQSRFNTLPLPAASIPPMNINLSVGPLIALIAGILILVVPRLLNFIVAIYLIIIGLLGLFGTGAIRI
jgi:hypothetical protein